MASRLRIRLITLVLVVAAAMGGVLFWRNDAPLLAAGALLVAVVAEMYFWLWVGERRLDG